MTPEDINEMKFTTKIGLILAVTIGLPVVVLLAMFNINNREHYQRRVIADNSTQISSVVMDGKYGGNDRGGLYYAQDSLIASSSRLIGEARCDSLWKTGLIYKFGEPYEYRISDLMFPYVLHKKSNSDTLVVHKDGYVFKFLLSKPEEKEIRY